MNQISTEELLKRKKGPIFTRVGTYRTYLLRKDAGDDDDESVGMIEDHQDAELIRRALNSFEAMRAILKKLDAIFDHPHQSVTYKESDEVKAALSLSEGKESEVGK